MNESAPPAGSKANQSPAHTKSKATRFLRGGRFRLRRQLFAWIALGLVDIGRYLPHRSLSLGRAVGMLWYWTARRNREWALRNLAMTYGSEKSPAGIERLARRSFQSVGMAAFELALASRWDADYFRKVAMIEGVENWRRAVDAKKGVIAVSAHFGSWEICSGALPVLMNTPVGIVVVGSKNAVLDRKMREMREAHGAKCYRYGDRSLGFLSLLRRNGAVAFLVDRGADKVRHVKTNFLGMRAVFPTGFAHLARATGAPVVPSFIVRDADTPTRHRIIITEPIFPDAEIDTEDDIRRIVELVVSRLEENIRHRPEQWAWMLYPWYDDTGSHGGTRRVPDANGTAGETDRDG